MLNSEKIDYTLQVYILEFQARPVFLSLGLSDFSPEYFNFQFLKLYKFNSTIFRLCLITIFFLVTSVV
jgi:hypothetical protein